MERRHLAGNASPWRQLILLLGEKSFACSHFVPSGVCRPGLTGQIL
jgi:hypothetical protein